MQVILSARAVWVAAKDAKVIEKAQTASMMTRKSQVEMVISCEGDAEVLDPATSVGVMVLGVGGYGGAEEVGSVGNGVVVAGAGIENAGTRCSSVCSVGGSCSSVGRSAAGWSLASSGGGR